MLKKCDTLHRYLYGVMLALFACCFASCSDDDDATTGAYDPTLPVTITDFVPKSGGVGQKLVVYGNNFGNDTSLVDVTIGGKKAALINCNDKGLYCFVPQGAYSGEIKVTVGNEENKIQEAVASEKFNYERKKVVGRIAGYRNEHDDQGWKDGPFSECSGFAADGCMKYDPLYPNRLYIVYDNGSPGIQCVDFETEMVTSIISKSMFEDKRLRSIDFTLDGQYMVVATDRDDRQLNSPCVWIVKRADDGTFNDDCSKQVLATYKQCNGAAIHPVNGELYFNSYENGQVFRLDMQAYFDAIANGETWDPSVQTNDAFQMLFTIQDVSWEFQINIHPSGKYAYIIVINQHYILRTDYNEATKAFAPPYIVAGMMKQAGWEDGVGTSARINRPYQGVFVKNPDYVAESKDDVYDFYFADNQNHAVRTLTPEGIVRTYAGRGSRTSAADNNLWGTDNGDLREVARFRDPTGIAYDETNDTFYVLDTVGRSLRTIALEEAESEEGGDSGEEGGDTGTETPEEPGEGTETTNN